MDFPYVQLNKSTKRPIIPIYVKHGDKAIRYNVLIDSGSDINVFDAEVAEQLGIDVRKGKKGEIHGIGSNGKKTSGIDIWSHEVDLFIPGEGTIKSPVAFAYKISDRGHGLLGQVGFFDSFIVRFDYGEDKISVKLKSPKPIKNKLYH